MNKTIVTLVFLFGNISGNIVTSVVSPGQIVFKEPNSKISKKLSPAGAAKYETIDIRHFEYVHIIFKGVSEESDAGTLWAPTTHVKYSVPNLRQGSIPYNGEHLSLTRSETVPVIIGLTRSVIFPAALQQCPDLADQESYPALDEYYIDYVGVEGFNNSEEPVSAVAYIKVPSIIEGMPMVECSVKMPASPGAIAQVRNITFQYLLPAISLETGLRFQQQ